MAIPSTVDTRADTGLSNSQLGIWLFLASETMLFGALFSSYVLLRTGAVAWPSGSHRLSVAVGALSTAILLGSGLSMLVARRVTRQGNWSAARRALAVTAGLGGLFLVVELLEYRHLLQQGDGPWRETFLAIYFALTGVHGLHVLGGVAVLAFLAGPGFARSRTETPRLTRRTETVTAYWLFVDMVWIVLFVTFHLT
jgi:heme/copper-type cytochrome/quinol oxidase subunit 3